MMGYSVLSLASLVWLFYAYLTVEDVTLWMDHPWQAWLTLILAPTGLFLVICGLISPNPASITFHGSERVGAIVAVTRHPVLWGFFLWAFGHVFPNGDARGVILFGGLSLFALFGMVILERRARRRLGQRWTEIAAVTSIVPFAAILSGCTHFRRDWAMLVSLAAASVITGFLLFAFHEVLFGVDPLLLALYGV
ncbi:putative membrane protein [Agrobacterium vitis]|nr:putative membrane protein [Agrobacterium vitis]MBE1436680.1 putative membrane protein [Agrobacterium vitis]